MGNSLKDLLSKAGFLFSLFFSYKRNVSLNSIQRYLYSGWVRRCFKSAGPELSIMPPLYLQGGEYIKVGKNFQALSRFRLEAVDFHNGKKYIPTIIIGDNVAVNLDCHFACINEIRIGNNVLFGSKIFITDHFHGTSDLDALKKAPNDRELFTKGPVIIEDNVWIGEGVAIMPNVRIGKNSIVGANAVVTKSFPENSLIVGNPAQNIRNRIQ